MEKRINLHYKQYCDYEGVNVYSHQADFINKIHGSIIYR